MEDFSAAAAARDVSLSPNSLEDVWKILRSTPTVLKHIPRAFRHQFGGELANLVRIVAGSKNVFDLVRLELFPRFVLAPLPRGGQRGRSQARHLLQQRLHEWRTTAFPDIIARLVNVPHKPARDRFACDEEHEVERMRLRVQSLVQAGSLSKAAKELVSTGIHQLTPSVLEKLKALHPQAALPSPSAAADAPEFTCENAEVKAAVLSFPTATAPRPSGLRADHLRECIATVSADVADSLLGALTELANRSLNGALPPAFAEYFLAARLLPFRKKDDGVRPIAVGEVLRRLVAKVAFRQILPDVQGIFPPTQVGVGVTEAVSHVAFAAHSAHQACLKDASFGILQIDVSNAFNTKPCR